MSAEIVKELFELTLNFLPPCSQGCGKPATKLTKCNCPMGETFYCDTCAVPLTQMAMSRDWKELPYATTLRKVSEFLDKGP